MANIDGNGHEDFYIEDTYVHAIRSTFDLDGVEFVWWATDDKPALVMITSPILGHKVGLTSDDPEACARRLASRLIRERLDRTASARGPK